MVNVIPPDHVDDVPVVEPNQHDDVLVVPEPVLVDEDEDTEEEEFKEEKYDMEVDIEEDENKPELKYPYEEWKVIGGLLLVSLREGDINSLFGSDGVSFKAIVVVTWKPMHWSEERRKAHKYEYYGKLILDLGNEVRSSVEQGTALQWKSWFEKLVMAEDTVECKNEEGT
ncbi:hypothetical protein Tco_0150109 [Tanacetum coccineum]